MWSDGETLWVADDGEDKLYAYNLADKARIPDKDFETLKAAGNNAPKGMWSDGETLWVADDDDDKLYAYDLTTKTNIPDKDFDALDDGNSRPKGIWSDGETLWVADEGDKLYAYDWTTKTRILGKEITTKSTDAKLHVGLFKSYIWSDGNTMWVSSFDRNNSEMSPTDWTAMASNREDDTAGIYAYNMWTNNVQGNPVWDGSRDTDKEFGNLITTNLTYKGNDRPYGIWSDGATMWVAEKDDYSGMENTNKIYAYRLSNAASLGSLKLTGHVPSKEYEDFEEIQLHPSFDSGTTRYTASVPYATESLTLLPKTLRPGDNDGVSYSPTGTATTKGRQFDLNAGENTISVTVTNGQATGLPRTRTYTVDVTREFFTFNDPSKDVSLSTNWIPANVDVRGLWTDGTTMWLSAQETGTGEDPDHFGKLYSYNLQSTNLVVSTNTLTHKNPYGIWADSTTMWIADSDDDKLYAYNISDGARFSEIIDGQTVYSKDISLDENNSDPQWIWSDGVTMWVTDNGDNTIYAYGMSNKLPDTKNINIANVDTATANRVGLWSDGATLWIADNADDKLFAYKLKTDESLIEIHCPDATEDFNTLKAAGNHNPAGIFSDGSTMWVVDNTAKKIFAYNQPLSANNKLKRLELSNVYSESTSMLIEEVFSSVTNNYSAYVVYTDLSTTVTAIAQDPDAGVSIQPKDADLATPGHQVNLADGDNTIIITVAAENAAIQEYTINVARKSGGRTPIRDFDDANLTTMTMMNFSPTGLWGNDTTIYVADKGGGKIYAYDLKNKAAVPANGFNMLEGMTTPWGIWSDGTNMWAVETLQRAEKILAYRMSDKKRDSDKEINASELYSSSIDKGTTGLWADGTNMWVADDKALDIYAYNMWTTNNQQRIWDGNRNDTEDFGFETSTETVPEPKTILDAAGNKNPLGIWSDETTMWVANGDPVRDENVKIYAYNLETKARDSAKDIDNLKDQLALDNRNEFKGGIWSDGTTMWVSVVHSDSRGKNLYAFNLPKSGARLQSDPSEDSTLKDLQLSGIGLNPVFSPDNTIYTALADHDVASTTVTATPNHSAATVKIFWASDGASSKSTASKGPYAALQEGYNIIVIDVEAEDGNVESYWIEITKAEAPPVSGGPLPIFQSASVGNNPTADSATSSTVFEKGKSRLIFAEPLLDGGVRFVFLVPPEEFKIETTPDLMSGEWRPLEDDEFKAVRKSNGDGQDRLTVILPQAEEKQRFLRLTPPQP